MREKKINQEVINKFLTERMGECWHEWVDRKLLYNDFHWRCNKCKAHRISGESENNDFFTWPGFGKLWEWAIKQEWWKEFLDTKTFISVNFWEKALTSTVLTVKGEDYYDGIFPKLTLNNLINPEKFAIAIAEYLGYNGKIL